MNNHQYCVIMAGGSGNRFWPIVREDMPKQFMDLAGTGKSFLRMTYDRFSKIVPVENIIVVTLDKYKPLVEQQIPEIPPENLLLEPYGRNTAPCITYSTCVLLKRDPQAIMIATPSDLIISDEQLFDQTIVNALDYVNTNDVLMTLGIVPKDPDVNFGYIQVKGGKKAIQDNKPIKVKTFTEKPDASLAEVFCKSGEFFWNSGMFLWKAGTILKEMERYIPEVTTLFNGWDQAIGGKAERVFIERTYTDCPKVSIDYGVMEKTDKAWLYPAKFGWFDVCSWDALYRYMPKKDTEGNAVRSYKYLSDDDNDNIVLSKKKGKLIAVKGLKDYIVVDTDDVLLICPKDDKKFKDFIAGIAMPDYEEFR